MMNLPAWAAECANLSGIVVVLVGFALRLKPTVVVVVAALVTGLAAQMPLLSEHAALARVPGVAWLTKPGAEGLLDMLGRAFADNRLMTLFIITLPAIGLSERFGLQGQAARVIRQLRASSVGSLLIVYQIFRVVTGIAGIRLGGHPTFVRPFVFPMALGAATLAASEREHDVRASDIERLKAAAAASENYGNFYGQNLSPVQPGILLVYGVLSGLGYTVSLWRLVFFAIPIAALSVVLGAIQFWLFGRRLSQAPESATTAGSAR
jgi:uncharacterized membrane protein